LAGIIWDNIGPQYVFLTIKKYPAAGKPVSYARIGLKLQPQRK
jgi:hypothetical protein